MSSLAGYGMVVTGASSGIGEATVRLAVKHGAKVTGVARRKERLEELQQQLGNLFDFLAVDLEKSSSVQQLMKLGNQDILICCAGRGLTKMPIETKPENIAEMMCANVDTVIHTLQAFVSRMSIAKHGHIIVVGSILGRIPYAPWRCAYSASKAALSVLVAGVRQELRKDNIHISLVNPGLVRTEFQKVANPTNLEMPSLIETAQDFPSMNAQTPDEVARVIIELIHHPKDEVYTRPEIAEWVTDYYRDLSAGNDTISNVLV